MSEIIVLVTEGSPAAARVSGALAEAGMRVLAISDWPTAMARISGGGVGLVVWLPSPGQPRDRVHDAITSLHKRHSELPLVVMGGPEYDDSLRAQASSPLVRVASETTLVPTSHALLKQCGNHRRQRTVRDGPHGIICVQGAKGGVGASTVALNLAAELAAQGRTILIEMQAAPGTLASQSRVRRHARTVVELAAQSGEIGLSEIQDCLSPCPTVPELSFLFGPQSLIASDWPSRTNEILQAASAAADYVVVDLSHCYSDIHRAALRSADCLVMVLERDPLCLRAGKFMLEAIESENLLPHAAAAVVVNRIPLVLPIALSELERALNVPVLASMPPAADLCLQAYRAQTPVVAFDPESLLAGSFRHLAAAMPAVLQHCPVQR